MQLLNEHMHGDRAFATMSVHRQSVDRSKQCSAIMHSCGVRNYVKQRNSMHAASDYRGASHMLGFVLY